MVKTIAKIYVDEMEGKFQEWRWFVRDAAKKHPFYHKDLKEGLYGETETGEKIPINTLGRLLFGTPGFKSCIITVPTLNGKPGEVQLDVVRFRLLLSSLGYNEQEIVDFTDKAEKLIQESLRR